MPSDHALELLDTPLGGSSLARAAIAGDARVAQWYPARPVGAEAWRARLAGVQARFRERDWLAALAPAIAAEGPAAERLHRVARDGGVLVTTGQQPGLFGGPLYTWVKAVSALALADELERVTGCPAAALFWAATDDTDYAEAAETWIATAEGGERLALPPGGEAGVMLAHVPLPDDVVQLRARLRAGAGSVADPRPLAVLDEAWIPGQTIGAAYVRLLRALLAPLGIPVLDAAHPATRAAMDPLAREALRGAGAIDAALRARTAELEAGGFEPQVTLVDGLSLVFADGAEGKARVPLTAAPHEAERAELGTLGPNVLLRPVMEQAILPTVAYVAGPGELAYFAQVSAVAAALAQPVPLALPRYSVTIVEPHVRRLLDELRLRPDDLLDPHGPERRLAREAIPPELADAFAQLRQVVEEGTERLASVARRIAAGDGPDGRRVPPAPVLEGAARQLRHRLERLERRLAAAAARGDDETRRRLAVLRGALAPGGKRQERALNLLPLLARHGCTLLEALRDAARPHARRCLEEAASASRDRPAVGAVG